MEGFSRVAAAASLDPRALSFPIALGYRFLGEGKNAESLKQIRAALSFAYRHWDLRNPFSKIEPPLQKEPQIRYNRAFNLRLRAACRAIGVGGITALGLRHSAATILLNHLGKDLREIQELLRHKNIRTTVRYTPVGYE